MAKIQGQGGPKGVMMRGKMMGPGGKIILNILVWNLGQDCIQES